MSDFIQDKENIKTDKTEDLLEKDKKLKKKLKHEKNIIKKIGIAGKILETEIKIAGSDIGKIN